MPSNKEPVVYLSVSEVAARIGVAAANIAAYRMPEPDALIGKTRGWKPETIDAWIAARPGSGNWGTQRAKDAPKLGISSSPPPPSLEVASASQTLITQQHANSTELENP